MQGDFLGQLPSFWALGTGHSHQQGSFEGVNTEWLRWCDREGEVLPTGEEKAALEHQRAERERQRAEAEYRRAERERQRAEALLELLRSHGIAPPEA